MFRRIRQLPLALLLLGTAPVTAACDLGPTNSPEGSLTAGERTALRAAQTLLIVKRTVTEAHKIFWSDPLQARAAVCDKPTRAEIIACLGPFTPTNNDKVVAALEGYELAATLAGTAIIAMEGDGQSTKDAIVSVTQAAVRLVGLFPKAETAATALNGILGAI